MGTSFFFSLLVKAVMEKNKIAKPEWGTLRTPDVLYPFGDITVKNPF